MLLNCYDLSSLHDYYVITEVTILEAFRQVGTVMVSRQRPVCNLGLHIFVSGREKGLLIMKNLLSWTSQYMHNMSER